MKAKQFFKPFETFIILIFAAALIFTGCKEDDPEPADVLDSNYSGQLKVDYMNAVPNWSVSTNMNVQIEKTQGNITIAAGTLAYSGDSINATHKIERSGQWSMTPLGELQASGSTFNIDVNAQVAVQNDVQEIFGKNFDGDWVLESEQTFNDPPNSDLMFKLDEATANGSVVTETTDSTSVTWTLTLTPSAR